MIIVTQVLKLSCNDIIAVLSERFEVPKLDITLKLDYREDKIEAFVTFQDEVIEEKPQAYWEYWAGWVGNHDKRIDDATCSKCGFKHPTVRGYDAPDQLYKFCPSCGRRMGKRESE